jgi:hypothetical protein
MRTIGWKSEEVTESWRKPSDQNLLDLFFTSINRMIKWRKVRLVEHVMHMGEMRSVRIILVERCEGKYTFGVLGTDGRIVFNKSKAVPATGREGP